MYKRLAVLTVSGILLAACGTSNSVVSGHLISKRKVNKGFFINNTKKAKGADADEQEARRPFIQYNEEQQMQELAVQENIQQENTVVTDAAPFNTVIEDSRVSEGTQAPAAAKIVRKAVESTPVASGQIKTNKESRQEFRQAKKEYKKAVKASDTDKVLLIVLCFLLPPLAVYLHQGSWNNKCWLNLLLTILCGIPGVIHALIVVLKD
jgi:uncharacterized membrane protein YqaE (UPF0057 family)